MKKIIVHPNGTGIIIEYENNSDQKSLPAHENHKSDPLKNLERGKNYEDSKKN